MIVKFLKASGGARSYADYLQSNLVYQRDPETGKNLHDLPKIERSVPPEHLRGDFESVVKLSESLQFAHTYTAGVIAFADTDNPTREQIEAVIDDFQRHAAPGLEDRTLWAWNLHRDKGNVELNFITTRCDLETGKHFNIAPPGHEKHFNAWRDLQNLEHGWASPNEPERQREIKPARGESLDRVADKETITEHLKTLIEQGQIEPNRQGVLTALRELGEITRTSDEFISIRPTGAEKSLRLKGGIYAADFDATSTAIAAATTGRRPSRSADIEAARSEAQRSYGSRAKYISKRYLQAEKVVTREPDRVADSGLEPVHSLGRGRDMGLLENGFPVGNPKQPARRGIPSAERRLEIMRPERQEQPTLPAGAINERLSQSRISRAGISLHGLRPRPDHGIPARENDQNRSVLPEHSQTHGRGFAGVVQRIRASLSNGVNYGDRIGKALADRIGQGFERINQWADRASKIVQWTIGQDRSLTVASKGIDRAAGSRREAGASLDAVMQRLGDATRNLDREIENNRTLNPSRSRGMGFGR